MSKKLDNKIEDIFRSSNYAINAQKRNLSLKNNMHASI